MAICDLTLAGCQVLIQLLSYFSSRGQGRGKGWVKIKTGSLTNGCHRQNRLSLGKINLNYCPFLNNVVGWRKTKIRNTFASAPFLRLNCSSSFPLSQPSNPPSNMWQGDGVWELWWVQDCSVLLLPPQGDLLLLQGRLGRMLSNLVYRKVSWN